MFKTFLSIILTAAILGVYLALKEGVPPGAGLAPLIAKGLTNLILVPVMLATITYILYSVPSILYWLFKRKALPGSKIILWLIFLSLALIYSNLYLKDIPEYKDTSITRNGVTETPYFNIKLPANLKQTLHWDHDEITLYQYAYESYSHSTLDQLLKVTAIRLAPQNRKEYPEWRHNTLQKMINQFSQTYHLSVAQQAEASRVQPQILTLGKQVFSMIALTLEGRVEIKFLVTIYEDETYCFILLSNNPDAELRAENLAKLLDVVKSVQYKKF